ncbi:pro-opiomelanocortin [Pteropus medius]|uniref:pro-opiomelanocortin n=1 Tax=Pteropus vampyrus TaxID=132908 RepID=UPI00196AEBD4|nr:pro-opiomelanocortin [Pteropus giganteus]
MPRSCCTRSGALLLALLLQASLEVHGWCLESSQCQDLTTESNLLVRGAWPRSCFGHQMELGLRLGLGQCKRKAGGARAALERSALPQACIRACKPDLSAETPVFPGNGEEQLLTENPRKYVMGHFRWDRFGRRNGSSGGAGQKRAEEAAAGDGGDGAEAGPREGKRSYSMEHFRWGKPVGKKRRPVKVYPNGAADESAEAFPLEFKRELAGERPELALSPEGPDEDAAARADLEYGLVAEAEAAAKKDEGPYRMEHFRWGSPPKDKRYGGFMTSEKSQTPLVTLFKNAIIKNAHKKGQ